MPEIFPILRINSGLAALAQGEMMQPEDTLTLVVLGYNSIGIRSSNIGSTDRGYQFEASIDGVNWSALEVYPVFGGGAVTGASQATNYWQTPTGGIHSVRIRLTSITGGAMRMQLLATMADAKITEKRSGVGVNFVPIGVSENRNNAPVNILRSPIAFDFTPNVTPLTNHAWMLGMTLRSPYTGTDGTQLPTELGVVANPLRQAPTPLPGSFNVMPFTILTAGTHTIVAGVMGLQIRAYQVLFTSDGANSLTVQSATLPITGILDVASGGQLVLPYGSEPWFLCATGDSLVFVTTGMNRRCGGAVHYTQV
jgi:hypothetical protein